MGSDLLWFSIGIVALALGADSALRGLGGLGRNRGVSAFAVGLLLAAFSGSVPDLAFNVAAVGAGHSQLALGNIVGSSIVNLGLVLGLAAVLRPFEVQMPVFKPLAVASMACAVALLAMSHNGRIGWLDGAALASAFLVAVLWLLRLAPDRIARGSRAQIEVVGDQRVHLWLNLLRIVVGAAILLWASRVTVAHTLELTRAMGVSELFAGLTFVAIGTSLPQIAIGVAAALRAYGDLLMASVLGSNLFNLCLLLGATALWRPYPVPDSLVMLEIPALIGFSAMLYPMLRADMRISRGEGAVLLLGFFILQGFQWASVLG